jgi:pimeloyl-ACP methyl ester carboxylesterase
VLCSASTFEAVRSHWAFRRIADGVAKSGRSALRFDYRGEGDSHGDVADRSLAGWVDDVVTAGKEMLDHSGVTSLSLLGCRLGAVAATLAAGRLPVKRIVLWDPAVVGKDYLDQLRRLDRARLQNWKSRKPSTVTPDGEEFLGQTLERRAIDEIERVDLNDAAIPIGVDVRVVLGSPCDSALRFVENLKRRGVDANATGFNEPAGWGDYRLLERQVLPARTLDFLVEVCRGATT